MSEAKAAQPARGLGIAALVASILLQSAAAVCSKQAGLTSANGAALGMVINPWYVLSLVALGMQAVAWMLVLRRFPLSVAYPISSLIFTLHLLWAWLIFKEEIAWNHLGGIVLIVAGVAVIGRQAATEGAG